jgi:hypothetical protein
VSVTPSTDAPSRAVGAPAQEPNAVATPAPDTATPAPDTTTPAPDTTTPAPDTATPTPDTATPAPVGVPSAPTRALPATIGALPTPYSGTRRVLRYPDLGATVHPYRVPPGLADELPDLYGSVFATLDWFLALDRRVPTGACVLDDPRHVVLFWVDGGTIEVLNKVFDIAPSDVERLCRALFRALPLARRIRIETMFPPQQLGLSCRSLLRADHLVIELPHDVPSYVASLGKSTRRTIRGYSNRIRRDFPDLSTDVIKPGAAAAELVGQLIAWKTQRFARHGRTTYWQTEAGRTERYVALAARCCEAHVTSICGRRVAIHLVCRTGDNVVALEGAFDPAYERYRLGFLSMYWVVADAIERGARSLNAFTGTADVKKLLGARPVPAYRLSVFRSPLLRLLYAREAARLAWGRRRIYYWRVRHAAAALARRARPAAAGGEPPPA